MLRTFGVRSLGYEHEVIGFDEALRREIRRHAAAGVSLSQSRQMIVADALAAQLVETLRDFVATLSRASEPTRVPLPGGSRWRKAFSPAGFVVHQRYDESAVSADDPSLLRRLALITTDARVWLWERGSSLTDPPWSGVIPVTGQTLRERRLLVGDGRIAVGETCAGQPAAVLEEGEPPWEPVEDVFRRIADQIVRGSLA